MRIASAGYYGGDPERVLRAPADWVLDLFAMLHFKDELQETRAVLAERQARRG